MFRALVSLSPPENMIRLAAMVGKSSAVVIASNRHVGYSED